MRLTILNHTNAQNMTLNFSSSTRLLEFDLSLDPSHQIHTATHFFTTHPLILDDQL